MNRKLLIFPLLLLAACNTSLKNTSDTASKRTTAQLVNKTNSKRVVSVAEPCDFESNFASHRERYRHVEGNTDEPSCGGTSLGVYLDGNRIKKLDFSIATSRRLILRDYYFDDSDLVLVAETVYWLLDKNGEHAKHPELESKQHFWITDTASPKKRELLDHADYLIHYYRIHANDFK